MPRSRSSPRRYNRSSDGDAKFIGGFGLACAVHWRAARAKAHTAVQCLDIVKLTPDIRLEIALSFVRLVSIVIAVHSDLALCNVFFKVQHRLDWCLFRVLTVININIRF